MKIGIPEIHAKELSILKEQATKALAEVEALSIKNPKDLEKAETILKKINSTGISIQNAKGSVTRPLNEELKDIQELFHPIEKIQQQAEDAIRTRLRDFEGSE